MERKFYGKNLLESAEVQAFINEYLPMAISINSYDPNLHLLHANEKFFDIFGYSREEFSLKANNSLLHFMLPEDRERFLSAHFTPLDSTHKESFFNARIHNKHSASKLARLKCKGVHIVHTDENNTDSFMVIALECDEFDDVHTQLAREKELSNILQDLSSECTFDYDAVTKTMRYSKAFAEKLEIAQIMGDYPQSFMQLGIVAPDSLDLFTDRFELVYNETLDDEVHFIKKDGQHLWYSAMYRPLTDANGRLMRIVGKLNDITKQKIEITELVEKSEKDQLTNLYNKSTAENIIKANLRKRRLLDCGYALMIVDIDNFKEINDCFGHLYGDKVLVEIAETMQKIFRSDDLIGRFGGDEFFVFIKNFQSKQILEQKATSLCHAINKVYTQADKNVEISASIGIAIFPHHGLTYEELYESADIALYSAKEAGKNTFTMYSENLTASYTSQRT